MKRVNGFSRFASGQQEKATEEAAGEVVDGLIKGIKKKR